MYKFDQDDIVWFGKKKGKICGVCIPRPDDTETRYGITLLEEFETVTYIDGSQRSFDIVLAVTESDLKLEFSKEKSLAEAVKEIENPVPTGSGV